MRVNLLIIATNKYLQFLEGLLDSASEKFLRQEDVTFSVFTDRVHDAESQLGHKPYFSQTQFFPIEHRPFPYPTLHRFHFFNRYEPKLRSAADYHFYIDVDSVIAREITAEEIVSNRTAVQHCGYVGKRGTYEKNRRSTSYVKRSEGTIYYGGGFWGFSDEELWQFTHTAAAMIDNDGARGITPRWHDESVLNRYLITNPPHKVLTPSFHWPQNHPEIYRQWEAQGHHYECAIMLLDKNHAAVRDS
jgi:histo-blood group ABO system transferase